MKEKELFDQSQRPGSCGYGYYPSCNLRLTAHARMFLLIADSALEANYVTLNKSRVTIVVC